MDEITIYEVGGSIRSEQLGLIPDDRDWAIEAPSYDAMKAYIVDTCGGQIYQEKPQYYTIKANIPGIGSNDYVLCREEGPYSDGRRPDWVKPGSIEKDLMRRDFTMNARARKRDGTVLDPFDGHAHTAARLIVCVGDTGQRMREDALRLLRAVRFCVTLDFIIHPDIEKCLVDSRYLKLLSSISVERMREELMKMFAPKLTIKAIRALFHTYEALGNALFSNPRLHLKPQLTE
jgi:tRNA nucleotidyltransferase (CCA-adding enzyme)